MSKNNKLFAIIESGSKQYKVSVGDKIVIDRIKNQKEKKIVFNKVLLVADKDNIQIGMPYIEKAVAEGTILGDKKGKKIIIFKYKPKKRYRRKKGHRQVYTEVEITKIQSGA